MLLLVPQDEQTPTAFDELVDRYERRVFNLIYRLVGDYDEASDLTQDTFVAAYRSYGSFRAECDPYTWLYRIAVNVCKNRFRERGRRRDFETLSLDDEIGIGEQITQSGLAAPEPSPERAFEKEEMRQAVETAIGNLPEGYRTVVVLRDLHGLTYQGVAEVTGLSLDVVRTRLARARGMLRRKLEHYLL